MWPSARRFRGIRLCETLTSGTRAPKLCRFRADSKRRAFGLRSWENLSWICEVVISLCQAIGYIEIHLSLKRGNDLEPVRRWRAGLLAALPSGAPGAPVIT